MTGPKEAIGGYTISTLLSMLSLKDYSLRYNGTNNVFVTYFQNKLNASLTYVEGLYFIKGYWLSFLFLSKAGKPPSEF